MISEAHGANLSTAVCCRTDETGSALAGFVAFDRLVDHVKAAAPANDAIVPMAVSQRFNGVLDLHDALEMPRTPN
jgi:hypothetical protein